MSKESTPVPILSYKKPLLKASSATASNTASYPQLPQLSSVVASPIVSAPGTPLLAATPKLGGTRKVSSRRKALQEYYKLQEAESQKQPETELHGIGITITEPEDTEGGREVIPGNKNQNIADGQDPAGSEKEQISEVDIESLKDAGELEKYIRTARIEEMLRLRNQAANKLNHHDVEKKSIIYDNYYELIKLSQVLSNLDVSSAKTNPLNMEEKPKVTDQYVNEVLGDLTEFLAGEGTIFNQDFELVAETIRGGMDDADSVASVRGIASS
ncbi:CIC11C00000002869 [Sungouiella intermedia]|uniref:CIC11C00000002869 n=1 Tax=Sungouiella intermedia TaxID=45354 RepID=A0A1L0CXC2_9ASCO|nr:CIC11C00000002869 [[Candida] intermedia]